ncbi:DUF5916 domain-containing protein [Pontimicrobium sp. SW4]|uniref:DUF5916 domain-containing protein n=1 Tax=Pontimicrobium sp. SW4 TaxID=3153519 RepID=A0AAU7BRC4_9FLAO
MKQTLLFLIAMFSILTIFSQEKKTLTIKRTNSAPKIDGVLNDPAWKNAEEAKDFVQFRPDMGVVEDPNQKTVVKMTYDDNAVYFAAHLQDNPAKIMKQFTTRDNFGQTDFFLIAINPNNNGQNDTQFVVFSSGTQGDAIVTSNGNEDWGWNAVWDSAVKIVDNGWVVEVKIPYSALRFSNKGIQTWAINFHRKFIRNNSQYSWNPLDLSSGMKAGQMSGEVHGIENITPPTRLSFYPFASGLTRSYDGETDSDFTFGMDLKYGITENFTLDATLVPDFSQAGFDNIELNLGPFEQQLAEQRQFFKEGVDLFNKGNLFYSRRIGSAPTGYPILEADEEVTNYPSSVKVLNALKLSGRTKEGLGVGFFNAITEKTEAVIKNNVTQETRREVVEPLANYNILVIDKQFSGNSSISLVNTNVMRDGGFRDANVTAGLFDITNKKNTFNYEGALKMSNVKYMETNETFTGFSGSIDFSEISGNFRHNAGYSFADKKYNINDMGIQFQNNYHNFHYFLSYRTFKPKGNINNFRASTWFNYRRLFNPDTYVSKNIGYFASMQFKNLWQLSSNMNWDFGKQYDYWEPRTDGRFFTYENMFTITASITSNQAKPLSVGLGSGITTYFDPDRDTFRKYVSVGVRFRFSDKFSLRYSSLIQDGNGDRGYVTKINDGIIFGQRDQRTIENSITGSYNFNSFHGLKLTFRNYWSTADYDYNLYTLLDDGSIDNSTGYNLENIGFNPNVNFSTWNLDFSYSWQFAPGSLLTALYRNSLFNINSMSSDNYFDSLSTLFDQPIEHVFSLRIVYYIDYNNIKGLLKKKRI